jgi:hypothetical protein
LQKHVNKTTIQDVNDSKTRILQTRNNHKKRWTRPSMKLEKTEFLFLSQK